MSRFLRCVLLLMACAFCPLVGLAQLPNPATGGKDGAPIDLLLYRGHSEWDFGRQPALDATYQRMLKARGYRITEVNEWQPLSLPYLRQFNTVVYLGPSACWGGGYFDHTEWRSGLHFVTVRQNAEVLRQYVDSGGGLFIVAGLEEIGTRTTESLQQLFKPYGLTTECAVVRDTAHAYLAAKIINVFPINYCWTEQIAAHPATAGVKRVYYPSYATRWDDNYTTIPLFPRDKAWMALAQSMPGTQSAWLRSTVYDPKAVWVPAPGLNDPAIVVARAYGKGRIAVTGISPFFIYYFTYAKEGAFSESAFSRIDGIAMDKGDGTTPSDLHVLLDNLYRWLAQGSLQTGMGGFDAERGVKAGEPQKLDSGYILADTWAKRDPTMHGQATRAMRVLVGAHSAMSDGTGTPAEWAAAAKTAGYDVVCFTEALETTDIDRWEQFVEACAAASDAQVALLPGLDMGTDLGDRFLVVGHTGRIRTHLLTEDRKQLFWTGHLLLGMGDVLPIAARPARLAQHREKGALPPDLYSHVPGVAVATYCEGKQVDDGMFAYQWLTDNASMPIPVAVHELFTPGELARAAKTGLQNYLNADTPANAAYYYRQGHASFGGNPARRYLSSGPLVDDCRIDNWQSPTWNVTLEAHSAQPITAVTVRDQYGAYRQFAPKSPTVNVSWSGNLGIQRWFLIDITDAKGGKALLSPLRTLPRLNTIRCMDRQNWFTPLPWADMVYTGRARTSGGASIAVPGVTVNGPYCPKFQVVYSGEGYYIHEFTSDSTYVPGGRDPGADNSPIFHDVPIPEFAGRTRYISFMTGRSMEFRQYLITVTLKKDLAMRAPVWPVFTKATGNAYIYTDGKTGQRVEGTISKDGLIDLPEGGVTGNLLALTPLRVKGDGTVGLACATDGAVAKAGAVFRGSYLLIDPKKASEIRTALGFDGPTPYTLTMTQGQHDGTALYLKMTAKDYGVAGQVTGGKMPLLGWMPVRLSGANPRWPVGLWQPSADPAKPGTVTHYDFHDGVALGRLPVAADGGFYFGNLLTATNPQVNLAFSTPWTKEGATVEVNNPTGKAITTIIRSPKAITDRLPINEKVTVPAGTTITVTIGKDQ
jgi:hypothetical protein